MKLNADNYEEWALDYLEGNLDGPTRAAFDALLAERPDIAAKIHELAVDMPVLEDELVVCPFKGTLMRGTRSLVFRRTLSMMSGAAAASVLVGGFVWFDQFHRHVQEREQEFVAQAQTVYQSDSSGEKAQTAQIATAPASHTVRVAATHNTHAFGIHPSPAAAAPAIPDTDATERNSVPSGTVGTLFAEPISTNIPTQGVSTQREMLKQMRIIPTALVPTLPVNQSLPRPDEEDRLDRQLASLIAPLDNLLPIRRYRTADEHGIEIISLIRIGNRN